MKNFKTLLLREKFIIQSREASDSSAAVPVSSNRIEIELASNEGYSQEKFIVRAQNMHSCVRMMAKILQAYIKTGPIMSRIQSFDWNDIWTYVSNSFEQNHNPKRWAAVYHDGKPVFKSSENVHPFLDLIEKCYSQSDKHYDQSVALAEEAFAKNGNPVVISYESNVALVINFNPQEARCGVIMRGSNRTTTFNFSAPSSEGEQPNFTQCLLVAAAFLEGVQLSFTIGVSDAKLKLGLIPNDSPEAEKASDSRRRIQTLSKEISYLEDAYEVQYRPERPSFAQIIEDAERYAHKIFEHTDNITLSGED